jgi:hypothetical protein
MHGIMPLFVALSLAQTAAPAPAAPARIAGRVTVEGANTPIAGARVMLVPNARPTMPFGPPPNTLTDQDGRFMFDRVVPGQYRVNIQKTGFVTPDVALHPITLAAGQSLDGIDVRMQKGGVIAGKLLDASGEPMSDARVMAMRQVAAGPPGSPQRLVPAPGQGPQQTNDLGEFRVTGLATGEYVVAAVPGFGFGLGASSATPSAGGLAPATTYYPGSVDPAGAQPLTVNAGQTIENITFTMQLAPAFRVTGIVVDENDAPVAGAFVTIMSDPRAGAFMGPIANGRSGDDGRFSIAQVPSGTYRVTASVPVMMNSGGSVTGGGIGAVSTTLQNRFQPTEVVINGGNVGGVRVVVLKPVRR